MSDTSHLPPTGHNSVNGMSKNSHESCWRRLIGTPNVTFMTGPPPPGDNTAPIPDPTSPPPPSFSMPSDAPPPSYAPPPSAQPPSSPPPIPSAPPPAGGYPPPGGYAGGGYQAGGYQAGGMPPAGYADNDEKNWALIAHFGGAAGVIVGGGFLGWVAPLIAMMTKGTQSPTVRQHAITALNFQIIWALVMVGAWILTGITCGVLFFVPLVVWIVPVVFGVIAGVKANNGEFYRYPMSANLVK